jgi:hypothetical protein
LPSKSTKTLLAFPLIDKPLQFGQTTRTQGYFLGDQDFSERIVPVQQPSNELLALIFEFVQVRFEG